MPSAHEAKPCGFIRHFYKKMAERESTPTAMNFELIFRLKQLSINILFPDFATAQGNRKDDENGSFWRSSAVETVLNGTSFYRMITPVFLLSLPFPSLIHICIASMRPSTVKTPNVSDHSD